MFATYLNLQILGLTVSKNEYKLNYLKYFFSQKCPYVDPILWL